MALRAMPFAIAALLAITAWGVGGYEPWAGLVLQLGALALSGSVFLSVVFGTSRGDRERFLALRRSQKKGSARIEIVEPTSDSRTAKPPVDPFYWMGYPFRRSGLGLAILLVTGWIALSLVPVPAAGLAILSPSALRVKTEAAALLGEEVVLAPWSVAPYLAFQDLLLWIAYVLLFFAAHHAVASRTATRRLSLLLVLVGVASGGYGLSQWLTSLGGGATTEGFQASGSFGNRNHYAFFQEMLLLIAIGWLAMKWRERGRRGAQDRVEAQEDTARIALFALGTAIIALSLLFSLSRSGITFAAVGGAVFLYLTSRARRTALGLVAALLTAALWIGVDPIVSRFELVPEEIAQESGRAAVWRDSLRALSDFWLTGSGPSSFQYVYPIYRSFGGRRFYSWAHNDYLQIGVELGVPGLALAGILIFLVARRAREVRRQLSDAGSSLRELHAGYCAAAIAAALHSFTDFGLHLPANAALFTVIVAVVTGTTPSRSSSRRRVQVRKKLRRAPPEV